MRIILASGSPRRRELLAGIGLDGLEIIPAVGEEKKNPDLSPAELVKSLALAKAEEVFLKNPGAVVIGADTVVSLDGKILGKPKSEAEAGAMLFALSGRAHEVLTGVAVISPEGQAETGAEITRVCFRSLDPAEIKAYVATGEPMDKAGAYGIQGRASLFVERLEGDYFNVVGLPLCRLGLMLKNLGVKLL